MSGTRRRWLLIALLAVSHCMFFAGGYFFASKRDRAEIGERALGSFIESLDALSYLEDGHVDRARNILRISLDGDLLTMFDFGTPSFDSYSVNSGRNPKAKFLRSYDAIRKKYPPIDYSDGGKMNQRVDEILKSAEPNPKRLPAD